MPKGRDWISKEKKDKIMMPFTDYSDSITLSGSTSTTGVFSKDYCENQKRIGHRKGTHAIITIRTLMSDKENWVKINNDKDYHTQGYFQINRSDVSILHIQLH